MNAVAEKAVIAPVPAFAIGDVLWTAFTESTTEQLPCPDCNGSQKWDVTAPSGEHFTAGCPRCTKTYSFNNELPSLNIRRAVGKVRRHVITGYEVNSRPWTGECAVRYRTDGSYIVDEDKAFTDEQSAQIHADALAIKANADLDTTVEVLKARHFSTLSMDEARTSEMKNGVWESHYHAGCLLRRVKDALDGENDDEERSPSEVIEDLREATRWDFGYHVKHLPLSSLIAAAASSSDPAVRDALKALPEAMVVLFAPASVGTHPEGQDGEAGLVRSMGDAVPKADAKPLSPITPNGA
jgi:hypothetical protein